MNVEFKFTLSIMPSLPRSKVNRQPSRKTHFLLLARTSAPEPSLVVHKKPRETLLFFQLKNQVETGANNCSSGLFLDYISILESLSLHMTTAGGTLPNPITQKETAPLPKA